MAGDSFNMAPYFIIALEVVMELRVYLVLRVPFLSQLCHSPVS